MDRHYRIRQLNSAIEPSDAQERKLAIFGVLGMFCPDCAIRIENKLVAAEGVLDAHFEYLASLGVVVFDPDMITTQAITNMVGQAGDGTRYEYAAWLLAQ